MRYRVLIACLALVVSASDASAQRPDRRGEVAIDSPEYQGVKANAPIPAELHIRNEGGSDGAGLCVISSILANGRYQHVPGLEGGKESALWRSAKERPGGYYPEKLAALVDEVMPGEKYASYVGTDPKILEELSAKGYPIGATMNTGALYNYAPIHHMISLAHYEHGKGKWACVVDNNDPGKFHWMPSEEYDRRWIDGGEGWAWIWTAMRGQANGRACVFVLIAAACVVVIRRVRVHAVNRFDHFLFDEASFDGY